MAVNRFYKGTPYKGSLYVPPVEFVAAALETAQKQYDVNFAESEALRNKYVKALPQDRARATELEKQLRDRIDQVATTYGGDYSQATKELIALKREANDLFSPNGEAGAIERNYSQVEDSLARERKRLASGEIDSAQLNLLQNYYEKQGPTTFDPNTRSYSQVQVKDLPKTYDIHKEFEEYMSKVKPRTMEISVLTGQKTIDGYHEFKKEKVTKIDPSEAAAGWRGKLNNDLQFLSYAQSLAELSGTDTNTFIEGVAKQYEQDVIPARTGIIEYSGALDYKEDWIQKENLRFAHSKTLKAIEHRNALSRIDYKHNLDTQDQTELTPSEFTLGKQLAPTYPELSKEVYQPAGGTSYRDIETGKTRGKTQPATYAYYMSNKNTNVNKEMLKSIKIANPNASDSELIDMYNVARKDTKYTRIHYYPFKTTAAQQEEANRLLPGLAAGTYRVYKQGPSGDIVEVENLEDKIEIGRNLRDKDNPLKSKYPAVGKAMGFTGHVPSGSTILPAQDALGTVYYVAEPKTNIVRANEELTKKAFGYVKDGRQTGDYFEIGDKATGKAVGLVGVTHYENGEPMRIFYGARKDGKEVNFNDPLTIDGRIAEPQDLERLLFDDETIKKLFPIKTKSAYEAEFITQ